MRFAGRRFPVPTLDAAPILSHSRPPPPLRPRALRASTTTPAAAPAPACVGKCAPTLATRQQAASDATPRAFRRADAWGSTRAEAPPPPPSSAHDASFPRSGGGRWRTVSVGGGGGGGFGPPQAVGAPPSVRAAAARAEQAAAATDSVLKTRSPPQTPICTQTRRCTAAASRPNVPEVVDEKRGGTGPARSTSADAGLPAPRQSA